MGSAGVRTRNLPSRRPRGRQVPGYTRPSGPGEAVSINSLDQVVGTWGTPRRAVLWGNGTITEFGANSPGGTYANTINDLGQAIGASSANAERVAERPVHLQEVFATLYHNLGIDVSKPQLIDPNGRPQYLVDYREPIHELV